MLADEEQSGMLAGSSVVVIVSRLRDRRLKRWIVDSVADWWILHSGCYQRSYQRCELVVAEIEDSSASDDARRGFIEVSVSHRSNCSLWRWRLVRLPDVAVHIRDFSFYRPMVARANGSVVGTVVFCFCTKKTCMVFLETRFMLVKNAGYVKLLR
ncbi:unnamed protein product [Vicia faba]|uniref:Uncharacterized protein n=1 Tax=Vicia faba TaxID=3906 RepID=A0AAV1B585_VICFA|nr:unnamed protein product [Vicia faba]